MSQMQIYILAEHKMIADMGLIHLKVHQPAMLNDVKCLRSRSRPRPNAEV